MQDSVYDYENQCWVVDGIIESCAHPDSMQCSCYGKRHAGQRPENVDKLAPEPWLRLKKHPAARK